VKVDGSHRPLVFDLVDNAETFKNQWSERRRGYVESYGDACLHSRQPVAVHVAVAMIRKS
jgi:hypothetical protein